MIPLSQRRGLLAALPCLSDRTGLGQRQYNEGFVWRQRPARTCWGLFSSLEHSEYIWHVGLHFTSWFVTNQKCHSKATERSEKKLSGEPGDLHLLQPSCYIAGQVTKLAETCFLTRKDGFETINSPRTGRRGPDFYQEKNKHTQIKNPT